jgi:uncharacterized protein YqeY
MTNQENLIKKIESDLRTALLKKEEIKIKTLRLLLAAIQNKEIELRSQKKELSDEVIVEVINREVKKRKEAVELYQKGGRDDLAEIEREELSILLGYLPEQLSDDKIRAVIKDKIGLIKASGPSDFGKVMGLVMKEIKGRADGTKVGEMVREELGKL